MDLAELPRIWAFFSEACDRLAAIVSCHDICGTGVPFMARGQG